MADSSKNTPTEAGRTGSERAIDTDAIVDAINRIFAEFELVYHNQYTKAFPTLEKLQYAKKLWFSNLSHLSPQQIINAAHRAIRESEFLPTIRGLLKYCDDEFDMYGLPDPRAAYMEACLAKPPQDKADWSHPAVYFAGKATGWFYLANNAEQQTWPLFERNYQLLCRRVREGEELSLPVPQALPEQTPAKPLSSDEQQQHLDALKESLKIR